MDVMQNPKSFEKPSEKAFDDIRHKRGNRVNEGAYETFMIDCIDQLFLQSEGDLSLESFLDNMEICEKNALAKLA